MSQVPVPDEQLFGPHQTLLAPAFHDPPRQNAIVSPAWNDDDAKNDAALPNVCHGEDAVPAHESDPA